MKWMMRGRPWLIVGILIMPLGGCDTLLSTNRSAFADEARVSITGESAVPLRVVTSTNFTAERDLLSGELVATMIRADTFVANSLPVDRKYALEGADRFLVRLVNPDSVATATVHMRLFLDGREVFNQRATMRDASLEYIAFYRP